MTEPSVLRIAVSYPAKPHNAETFIRQHLEGLRDVHLRLSDGELPARSGDGTPLVALGGHDRIVDRIRAIPYGGRLNELLRVRLVRELQRMRVQVLLAEYGTTGQRLVPVCAAANVPMVVHFHGHDAYRPAYIKANNGYREMFAAARRIVVVSEHMRRQLLALGAPPEKLVTLVYGVDTALFAAADPAHAPAEFIAVGRFTGKKAPLTTLEAFRQVWAERPHARLVMYGDGALLDDCRRFVRQHALQGAVRFAGRAGTPAIARAMRSARAFVQHSVVAEDNDHEGTPVAIIEAMASGLPVVSTRHAGIPDVVAHGERGLLVDEHDVTGMAAHMLRMVDEPDLAAAMGRRGRAYVTAHLDKSMSLARLQATLEEAAH
ncbi:MAG: glycosyltransferase [Flavobacteriales bacterium]|nr:glycosyltransferase [Flavobacteriales bacterium]